MKQPLQRTKPIKMDITKKVIISEMMTVDMSFIIIQQYNLGIICMRSSETPESPFEHHCSFNYELKMSIFFLNIFTSFNSWMFLHWKKTNKFLRLYPMFEIIKYFSLKLKNVLVPIYETVYFLKKPITVPFVHRQLPLKISIINLIFLTHILKKQFEYSTPPKKKMVFFLTA